MRAVVLEALYEWSKVPYRRYFKQNEAWPVSVADLVQYPENSLGFHLAGFLLQHSFELQPKLESHDVFHMLTGTGTSVPEEVAMQFYLLGNGKRGLYLYSVVLLGTVLYPDYINAFLKAYRRGKRALAFHQLDFSKLLFQPIKRIQTTFLIR